MAGTALNGKVACVTALDVLEHLEDDARAVREFHRVLQPGGIAVTTAPADMRLWSDWDETLLHFRRYDRSGLMALFDSSEWELILCRYRTRRSLPGDLQSAKVAKSHARGGRENENESKIKFRRNR